MPAIAVAFSILGLVPLVFFAFGAVGPIPETAERMLVALIDYAALVLSFSGGVHWGLALLQGALRPSARFGASTLPLIVGWVGLMLAQMVSPTVALIVLVVGYLAMLLTEQQAAQRLPVPPRYMWIRWGFSVVSMVMMVMVLILRGIGQTIVF
jgi:hypothetical protein